MTKCLRCGRVLISEKSKILGYGKTCQRILLLHGEKIIQEENKEISKLEGDKNIPDIEELVNRVRSLELDNNFIKHQLKHKIIISNNSEDIERIKQDNHRPERDEVKVQFNIVVKELKIILQSKEPILKKGFRFSDNELGLNDRIEYGIEVNQINLPIMVEV